METKRDIYLINENKNETETLNQKLITLVKKHLMSPDAQTIKYDGKDRAGYKRAVCGHSPDNQISFIVSATYHSDFTPENSIGLKGRDFVEVVYINRKNKTDGALKIINSEDKGTFIASNLGKDLSDNHIKFWDEGGGLKYYPIGPEMKTDDIQKVSEILLSGIDDKDYTEKALQKLNVDFPHTKISDNLLFE